MFVAAGESLFAEYEDNTRQGQVKLKIMEELQTATTFLFATATTYFFATDTDTKTI